MHHLVVGALGQQRADLLRLFPADALDVFGGVIGQAAGDAHAGGREDFHHVAALERAVHPHDPRRQQAAVLLGHGGGGALVHGDLSGGAGAADPATPPGPLAAGGDEQRAHVVTVQHARQHVFHPPVGDDQRLAGLGHHPRRLELGVHPPAAEGGFLGADEVADLVEAFDEADRFAALVEDAVHHRQQHEQVGAQRVGHQRREDVVVAEADLHQLVGADRVVLVDDRHGPQLVGGVDRVADVEEAGAVVDVLAGEQDLGDGHGVWCEGRGPHVHQPPLPHRRHRLELGQVGRAPEEVQLAEPRADGARRHHRHRHPPLAQGGDLFRDRGNEGRVEAGVLVAEQLRPELDDGGAYASQVLFANFVHARGSSLSAAHEMRISRRAR